MISAKQKDFNWFLGSISFIIKWDPKYLTRSEILLDYGHASVIPKKRKALTSFFFTLVYLANSLYFGIAFLF